MFVLKEKSSSVLINPPDERLSVRNCQISKEKNHCLSGRSWKGNKKLNSVMIDCFQVFIQQFSDMEVFVWIFGRLVRHKHLLFIKMNQAEWGHCLISSYKEILLKSEFSSPVQWHLSLSSWYNLRMSVDIFDKCGLKGQSHR